MSDLLLLLRLDLVEAREHGLTFEDAWPEAIARRVALLRSLQEREQWRAVFADTEPSWRAAYSYEVVHLSRSITLLRDRELVDVSGPARRRRRSAAS